MEDYRKIAIELGQTLISKAPETREDVERMLPELKESEGERIRKMIINTLNRDKILTEDEAYDCVAWLEEQERHKKFRDSIQVGDKVTKNEDGVLVNLSQLNRVANKQGEQKPAMIQWKGDNLKDVIEFTGKYQEFDKWFRTWYDYECYVHSHDNIFKLFNKDGSHFEVPVGAWIVKTPDGYNVASRAVFKQKPKKQCAWSEEDETIAKALTKATNDNVLYGYIGKSKLLDWLESLKDRVQPKQEWSEEDETTRNALINLVEMYYGSCFNKSEKNRLLSWLKSLRPQNKWKPSDEQMEALYTYIYNPQYFNSQDPRMELVESVYKDLKKLKEE